MFSRCSIPSFLSAVDLYITLFVYDIGTISIGVPGRRSQRLGLRPFNRCYDVIELGNVEEN
jgi:hypothetical protein